MKCLRVLASVGIILKLSFAEENCWMNVGGRKFCSSARQKSPNPLPNSNYPLVKSQPQQPSSNVAKKINQDINPAFQAVYLSIYLPTYLSMYVSIYLYYL